MFTSGASHDGCADPGGIRRDRRSSSKPRQRADSPQAQIQEITRCIETFGFLVAILALRSGIIVAGHGRWLAAKRLGLKQVPVVYVDHLSPEQIKAYAIAHNQLALKSGWDNAVLGSTLLELQEPGFELQLTGFSISESDAIIDLAQDASPTRRLNKDDRVHEPAATAITRPGDVWIMNRRHRLLCGSALEADSYTHLMQGAKARLVFADPPYNVPIDGSVSGLGQVQHRDFAMASGEMNEADFTDFLATAYGYMAAFCVDGAIVYACMDFRHMSEMLGAGRKAFTEFKQLIVWVKKNGGMGTFYRSQHELIFVFKAGAAPHTNTFGLGETGRYRTNVWQYAGVNSFRKGRSEELRMHPTVKPVALVRDAILDVSERGEIVLDPFVGSGTTIIAAESCGRTAYAMELDPLYCDVVCRRFQAVTGKVAVREGDGLTFEEAEDVASSCSKEAA